MADQSLYQKATFSGPAVYYEPAFRTMLESHLQWLINHSKTVAISVKDIDALKYRGDFDGLMKLLGIPKHFHWIIMRMNGLTSPLHYSPDMVTLLTPDTNVIVDLQRMFKTVDVSI